MNNEPKQILLKDLSIEQLKSIAYDQIVKNEQGQAILQALNQEIASREEPPKTAKQEKEEDKEKKK